MHARTSWCATCTRSTTRPGGRSDLRLHARSPSSTTSPTRSPSWRSTGWRRPSRCPSTAPATGPTARSGAESSCTRRGGLHAAGELRALSRCPGETPAVLHPPRIAFALLADGQGARRPKRQVSPGSTRPRRNSSAPCSIDGVNCPVTTSLGRIFDAAAAILGLVERGDLRGRRPDPARGLRAPAFRRDGAAARARAGSCGAPSPSSLRGTTSGSFSSTRVPLLARLTCRRASDRRIPGAFPAFPRGGCPRVPARARDGCAAHTGVSRIALSGGCSRTSSCGSSSFPS